MKPHFKQKHPLFVALTAMTVSILTLFALSYIIVINSSNRLNTNAAELKIVTSQRSLSEEITNSVAADNLEGKIWGPPLRNLLNSFSYFHRTLLYGDAAKNIAPLKQDLFDEYHQLDAGYLSFFKQLENNISNNSSKGFVDLLNAENLYLQQLDNFTEKLTGYSNDAVRNFRLNEVFILCVSLIIVFMEIRLIFMPAITKIERQNSALREISFTQSHIVRRPLANIQGLLNLTLDTKNQDPYHYQLLQLAKKEADELDALIRNNIYKSDTN
ncbi:MAG TPA: hypothetical protein VHB70_06135 [Parafilimonas sp.]|nr:hypothetical protein [Parafilimonas sp.]